MRPVVWLPLALGLLCGCSGSSGDAPKQNDPPAAANSATVLQGRWKVVGGEEAGKPLSEEALKNDVQFLFDGDKVTEFATDGARENHFRINPSETPPTIDFIERVRVKGEEGEYETDNVMPGIYKPEGDTLTLCVNVETEERPDAFRSSEKPAWVLFVLRRVTQ